VIRVVSLVENTADKAGLLGEHGLAMWLEVGDRRVVFDTGQGLALVHNAHELGVPLHEVDAIVLSHGHYDHTGGLAAALEPAPRATVYAHPGAFRLRFKRDAEGGVRSIGMRDADRQAVQREGVQVVEALAPTMVAPGLFATGPVPRKTEYEESATEAFFADADCRRPDPLDDDQALFFDTDRGVAVLLGCAHAGAVNTLAYVQELTGGRPMYAVIGGMHLRAASQERISQTADALERMQVAHLRAAHCTGPRAVATLWNRFPDRCGAWSVGTSVTFAEKPVD